MKNDIFRYIGKVLLIILGCLLISIAVDFYLKSGIGGDAVTSLLDGLNKKTNLPIPVFAFSLNALLILIMLVLDYKKIGVTTIIIVIIYTPILNFYLNLNLLPEATSLFSQIIYSLSGSLFAALAISSWLQAKIGYSPVEGVVAILAKLTNRSFTFYKVLIDLFFLTIGYFLGGTVSYGTVIAAFLVGPLIALILKTIVKIEKVLYTTKA